MGKSIGLAIGIFVALLTVIFLSAANSEKQKPQVVMISIDGFRPEFYISRAFKAPTLKKLMSQGAWAESSESVFPSVTYPNHTTLITGMTPSRHGILSNTLFTWNEGPQPAWYWEASHIKSPTLLSVAHDAGLTTSSVRWPVTLFGHADYLIPEIFSMTGYYEGSGWDLTTKYTDPKLMREITSSIPDTGYANEEQVDHWVSYASAHILSHHSPNLTVIHLANVDHVAHASGPSSAALTASVEDADTNVQRILTGIDLARACVAIVGDHGFFEVEKSIKPNVLFARQGWINLDRNGKITSWKVVAHASGGQAAIYLKDKSLKTAVAAVLRDAKNLGLKLISRHELQKLGAYPEADFAVSAKEGFTISGNAAGEPIDSASIKGQHGHLPSHPKMRTGFIAAGCGIEAGQTLGHIRNLDIAPTVAQWLGVSIPGVQGQPLPIRRSAQ